MSYLSSISDFLKKKPEPISVKKSINPNELRLIKLETKLSKLTKLVKTSEYDFNALEESIYKLEVEIDDASEETRQTDSFWKIDELTEQLNTIKKETSIFEKEAVQDLEFPNRIDDDFDEESMSFENEY